MDIITFIYTPIPGWVACILSLFLAYKQFFQKPKVKLTVQTKQYDNNKGKNAYLDPINTLEVLIANHSEKPVVIRDVELLCNKEEGELDNKVKWHVHDQIKKVIGKNLFQGEEITLGLSYVKADDKLVLDRLQGIKVITTYGHEYIIKGSKLKDQIRKVQELKPPNPENLRLAKSREKTGCHRYPNTN